MLKAGIILPLEHCAKKWEPVFRKSNATTRSLRGVSGSSLALAALSCVALAACTPVDRGFGETVRLNNLRHTVNPEGMEPSPGAPIEGGSGAKADTAVERYEKGAVIAPEEQSSREGAGGS